MTMQDVVGLVASFIYPVVLILVAEAARRFGGYTQDFTRKLVHIGAGMWVFGVLALFDHWYIGIIPFASFIVLNWIFYRLRIFESMDASDSSPGTIYFAISVTLLFLLLWRPDGPADRAPLAVAGVMAMTWGDASAAVIGKRWGRRRYRVAGVSRSFEGSAAMFMASATAMTLTLLLLPGSALSPTAIVLSAGPALAAALVAAGIATVAEGVSPAGTDNLSVPLLASASLVLLYPLFT